MADKTPTPQLPSTEKPAVAAPYEGTRGLTAPSHLLTTPAPPAPQPAAAPAPAPATKSAE